MIRLLILLAAGYWACVTAPPRPERYDGEAVDTWGW
jgi:hypothetical protein